MTTRRNNPVCGFTLIEMLVSLAVLGLALTIVGVVFSVATNTTRQAAAYSEVQNWLRQFTLQLQEDLKHCEPAGSVLVLVGRTQAAALTQADLDARRYYRVLVGDQVPVGYDPEFNPTLNINYSDPRADIMMFLTSRPTSSQAPPRGQTNDPLAKACQEGARFAPILVAYGHAALDDAVWNGSTYSFADNRRHIEQDIFGGKDPLRLSRLPASQWHLARRATIVQSDGSTGNISFNSATRNRLARCVPSIEGGQPMPGDAAYLDVPALLARLNPSPFWSAWTALASPYNFDGDGYWAPVRPALRSLLYAAESESLQYHHVATVIESPPVDLETNLGVHLLPGCVWFQVEFLMPEDPRNSLDYSPPTNDLNVSQRYDLPRWTPVEPGQTYVFVPDTAANRELVVADPMGSGRLFTFAKLDKNVADNVAPVANRRVRMWPYAIRVTVRVMDRQGRLEEPLVRSIVHRFD